MDKGFGSSGSSPQGQSSKFDPERHDRIRPLYEVANELIMATFYSEEKGPALSEMTCRRCGAKGHVSIFTADGIEAIRHEGWCEVGRAIRNVARMACYRLPNCGQVSDAIKAVRHTIRTTPISEAQR